MRRRSAPANCRLSNLKTSLKYFKTVTGMADDLKADMNNSKTLVKVSLSVRQICQANRTPAHAQRR